MEINVLRKGERELLIEVKGESFTLTNALKEALWKEKNVLEAAQIREHPYLSEPKIFLKVEKGSPLSVLEKVVSKLVEKVKEIQKEWKKVS